MRTLLLVVGMLLGFPVWSQPIQRQFFTTNLNPRVIVAAGTNVTVQYTTTGTDIRTYTVNSSGGGGTGQTNWDFNSITNAPWQWGSQNLTNWSQLSTNLLEDLDQTNWPYTSITNAPWQWGSQNLTNWSQLSTNNVPINITGNAATATTATNLVGGSTNQVYTQTGWSGYVQVSNITTTIGFSGPASNLTAGAIAPFTTPTKLLFLGDSITWISAPTYPPSYAYSLTNQFAFNNLALWTNAALNGAKLADLWTSFANITDNVPSGGTDAVCFVMIGVNDIRVGAATTYNDATTWIDSLNKFHYAIKTNGFKLFVFTIMDCADIKTAGREGIRDYINYSILTSTNADWILRSDAVLPDYSNLFYMYDGLHPTNTGSALLARAVYNALLRPPKANPGLPNSERDWQQFLNGNVGVFEQDGIGYSPVYPALWLTNGTAAANGVQQQSPALMFGGQGFRTGNSTTMPVSAGFYVLPVQGSSSNPSAYIYSVVSISNAAPTSTGLYWSGSGILTAAGVSTSGGSSMDSSVAASAGGALRWSSRSIMFSPADSDIQLLNSAQTGFNKFILGKANNDWPAIKVEASTNNPSISIRTGADANYASLVASNVTAVGSVFTANMIVTNNLTLNGTLTVSNITGNFVHSLYATNGYTVCTTAKDVYLVNAYTNPMFVLPDATTVKGQEFIFSTTNRGAFFIVTNATGTQPVADGTSLSYTNTDNGLKVVRFISDGAAWWLSSKGRVTLPCASWSCSTNTTFANVTNSITLNTVEMNNLSGIYLDNSAWFTAGVGSRMWVTNPGVYMLTFSAVWSKVGGGAANGDIWLRQNGTDIPRTMTLQTIQNSSTTNVMTVNFMLPVTGVTYFDLQGASPDGSAQLQAMPAITSPFNRPACPSIIVTLNKTSD